MYGAKCMLVGMGIGIVIGASNTLVQEYVKSMCKCSKNLVGDCKDNLQNIQQKVEDYDLDSINKVFTDKLDQLKRMLDEINQTLSKEEIIEKVKEVKEQVETLFKEIKQSFSI